MGIYEFSEVPAEEQQIEGLLSLAERHFPPESILQP